jgi:cobalt-zinc-cadmium efflux system membrane fusion protein
MKLTKSTALLMPLTLAFLLAGCGGGSEASNETAPANQQQADASPVEGKITLSPDQIASAGIQIARPTVGGRNARAAGDDRG